MKLKQRQIGIENIATTLRDASDNIIPVSSTGYIAQTFIKGEVTTLKVSLKVAPGLYFIGIALGNNMPHTVEELSYTPTTDGGRLYERNMRILSDAAGTPYPDPANNIVRLVGITGDGAAVMWNLAVVSQGGMFYLTTQEMFACQAYKAGDKISIPGIGAKKWQLLRKYLEDMLAEPETFSKLTMPELPLTSSNGERKPEDGEVIWYSQHMQTGCIQTRRGQASVHWTSIKTRRPDGLSYLLPGEKVAYDLIARPPKPSNQRQSQFEWEAKDVTVND